VLRTYLYLIYRLFAMPLPPGIGKTRPPAVLPVLPRADGVALGSCLGLRLGRFSADHIGKVYGCEGGCIPLNRARLHQAALRTSAFARRRCAPNHNESAARCK